MVQAAAHMVLVLGNVGQVRKVAERTDHADRLVVAQVLQQPVQRLAGAGVVLQPEGHRQLAHLLDQRKGGGAFLLADHLAQQPAEQADVVDQGFVLGGSVTAGHFFGRAGLCTALGRGATLWGHRGDSGARGHVGFQDDRRGRGLGRDRQVPLR